jgi:hypothetical protein
MEQGKAHPIPKFTFRDIRRTCETLLASIGVDRETRAQLLSHGRSGVQAKHYDRYNYLAEKQAALVKWNCYLTRAIRRVPAENREIEPAKELGTAARPLVQYTNQ